jgi:glycosyltransferase involved in cell wall biosynthesis
MISVLILTKNEERDLPGCLESVAWSDDVHVFDSYSTDRTVEIARAAGAEVHQRVFDDYASHRNAALNEIRFKHRWVFLVDADERPTAELVREMQQTVLAVGRSAQQASLGFRLRRRDLSVRQMVEACADLTVLHTAGAAGEGAVYAGDQRGAGG